MNRPLDSSNVPSQTPTTSNNQPSISSQNSPQNSVSSGNQQLNPAQNSDSPVTRPLDSLQRLNPLGKLNSLNGRHLLDEEEFPHWVTQHSRRFLARGRRVRANVVVAKDGSGKFKTITQALAMVPKKNRRKFVIHIKKGVYKEKVEVTKNMHNVVFIGDGPTKTIITGDVAFLPNRIGTFRTATVGKFLKNIFYILN